MSRLAGLLSVALAALSALAGTGCGGGADGTSAFEVVATTTQIGDLARQVAGADATVVTLLSPNGDPHEFEPTPKAAAAVASADVLLTHGMGLDDWAEALKASAGSRARIVLTTAGISARRRGDADDPHVWLDPRNAQVMVSRIADGLAAVDEANATGYRSRAEALRTQIGALDAELAASIATVPRERRKIVTDHDAFGYFADRYGVEIVATILPSVATGAEPSARDIARISSTIRAAGVRAVFPGASSDPRLVEQVAKASGVALGDRLFTDSLGPPDGAAGTYLDMMRANMDTLAIGLGE